MILFEKVRWKNFLSTGNQYSEINFQSHATTLIVGDNGTGKSTVLDALTFSLFGKPFRKINKGQLTNATNEKDCSVEVEFSIGTISWKVSRGIKPNKFEIYRDDKLLDHTTLFGSWAGAFGNFQFMPSTIKNYAIDYDGNNKIELKTSLEDSLASAANYIRKIGWRKNEPCFYKVKTTKEITVTVTS